MNLCALMKFHWSWCVGNLSEFLLKIEEHSTIPLELDLQCIWDYWCMGNGNIFQLIYLLILDELFIRSWLDLILASIMALIQEPETSVIQV